MRTVNQGAVVIIGEQNHHRGRLVPPSSVILNLEGEMMPQKNLFSPWDFFLIS